MVKKSYKKQDDLRHPGQFSEKRGEERGRWGGRREQEKGGGGGGGGGGGTEESAKEDTGEVGWVGGRRVLRGYRRREREERRGRRGEKGEGGELEENLITRHFPLLFIDDVSKQRIAMKVFLQKGKNLLDIFTKNIL